MKKYAALYTALATGLIAGFLSLSSAYAQPNDDESQQRGERRGPPPFAKLDLDQDGIITFDEFEQHPIPRGEHAEVFSNIDTDSNGQITEQEWTNHKPPRPQK